MTVIMPVRKEGRITDKFATKCQFLEGFGCPMTPFEC